MTAARGHPRGLFFCKVPRRMQKLKLYLVVAFNMASCTGATMALASLLGNEFKMFKLSKLRCLHLRLFVQRLPALPQGALPCCQNHRISSISASSFDISAKEHPQNSAHTPKTSMSARFELERTPKQCISSISACLFHLKAPPAHQQRQLVSHQHLQVKPTPSPRNRRIIRIRACPFHLQVRPMPQKPAHQQHQSLPVSPAGPPNQRISNIRACPFYLQAPPQDPETSASAA